MQSRWRPTLARGFQLPQNSKLQNIRALTGTRAITRIFLEFACRMLALPGVIIYQPTSEKNQTPGGLINPPGVVIGLIQPDSEYYFFIFLRATIAAPSNPVPNSTKVPGSGISGASSGRAAMLIETPHAA